MAESTGKQKKENREGKQTGWTMTILFPDFTRSGKPLNNPKAPCGKSGSPREKNPQERKKFSGLPNHKTFLFTSKNYLNYLIYLKIYHTREWWE